MINHFSLMIIFSLLVSIFFGVLLREKLREMVKLALILFLGMVVFSLLIAWIMYPFPS